MAHIIINGQSIPYQVIRSKRKTSSIEITREAEVILRIPMGLSNYQAERMIETKRDWIDRKRQEILAREPIKEKSYESGTSLQYLGQKVRLRIEREHAAAAVHLEGEELVVCVPGGYQESVKALVVEWYRGQAKERIMSQVQYYADKMGVSYHKITLKDQKTRWGSCSSKGNLNFNYRLIMAPPEVLEYVVVHELCHRVHMNHSAMFWSTVAAVMPGYLQWRMWLKVHGQELMV